MTKSKQKTQKTLGKTSKKRTLKSKNTYIQKDILNYTPSGSSEYTEIPDTSKLIIGDNLTYKQLCTLLKVPTNGGNAKKIQIEDWLRYFDYEKNGTRFLITDIYDEPLNKEYKYPSNAIYIKYIETMLLSLLASTEGNRIEMSPGGFYRYFGMVNSEYERIIKLENKDRVKVLQKVHEDLTDFEVTNFFNRCRTKFSKVIKSAFDSLQRRMLIKYSTEYEFYAYEDDDSKIFKSYIASDKEIEYILKIKREALLKCGCDNEAQIFLRKKEKDYYDGINNRILEEKGWFGVHKIYVINYCRDTSIQALQQDHMTLQKYGLNAALINFLDEQAKRNYIKTASLPRFGYDFRYPENYVDLQKLLSYKLLNIDKDKPEPSLSKLKKYNDGDWLDLI